MKLKLFLFSFIYIAFTYSLNAQNCIWAKSIGTSNWEHVIHMTTDANNNVYATGNFLGTMDCDPDTGVFAITTMNSSNYNGFVTKLDSSGNFSWAINFPCNSNCTPQDITTDFDLNVIVVGANADSADFNPGPNTYMIPKGGFISKFDRHGNLIWVNSLDSALIWRVKTDLVGNIFICGSFSGTTDFDPGPQVSNLTGNGAGQDAFIAKYNMNGDFIWAKSFWKYGNEGLDKLSVDDSSNVYACASFNGTIDLDPGVPNHNFVSAGDEDTYVLKLDKDGNFVWAKSWGGPGNDQPDAMTTDKNGNSYVYGSFEDSLDIDPGSAVNYFAAIQPLNKNAYNLKLDKDGNLILANNLGEHKLNVSCIAVDEYGNTMITGGFVNTVDFDPGPGVFNLTSYVNGADIFMSTYDSTGSFIAARGISGTGQYEIGTDIAWDRSNNIVVTGFFGGTADFGPPSSNILSSTAPLPDRDYFIAKYSNSIIMSSELEINNINGRVFPNPTNGDLSIVLDQKYSRVEIELRNILSQEILRSENQNTSNIDLHFDGMPGIYFLTINCDGKKRVTKILKY